jgi:hypothetical protein
VLYFLTWLHHQSVFPNSLAETLAWAYYPMALRVTPNSNSTGDCCAWPPLLLMMMLTCFG